jgi:hypothetical protein
MTKAAEEGVREGVTKNIGDVEDIKSIRAVMKQDDDLTNERLRKLSADGPSGWITKVHTLPEFLFDLEDAKPLRGDPADPASDRFIIYGITKIALLK